MYVSATLATNEKVLAGFFEKGSQKQIFQVFKVRAKKATQQVDLRFLARLQNWKIAMFIHKR